MSFTTISSATKSTLTAADQFIELPVVDKSEIVNPTFFVRSATPGAHRIEIYIGNDPLEPPKDKTAADPAIYYKCIEGSFPPCPDRTPGMAPFGIRLKVIHKGTTPMVYTLSVCWLSPKSGN